MESCHQFPRVRARIGGHDFQALGTIIHVLAEVDIVLNCLAHIALLASAQIVMARLAAHMDPLIGRGHLGMIPD